MKELQDPNVEHLLPYKNGKYPERKFDWENLFWSCGHCNGIKNSGKYDAGIIDCCRQDPEQYLTFQLRDDRVVISVKQKDELYKRTATLITETFTLQNTGMRTYSSNERLRLLQKEMDVLYKQLEKLHNRPDSKITMRTICNLLKCESAFAAFKRCYVREHADQYPQLQKYLLDSEEV